MRSVPVEFLNAISRSHSARSRVEVLDGRGTVLSTVEAMSGSVRVSTSAQVRRTVDVVLPLAPPRRPSDLLATFGNRVRVYRGILLPSGWFDIVQGVFRIEDAEPDGLGSTKVAGSDLSSVFSDAATGAVVQPLTLGTGQPNTGVDPVAWTEPVSSFVARLLAPTNTANVVMDLSALLRFATPAGLVIPAGSDPWAKAIELCDACACELRMAPGGYVEARDRLDIVSAAPVWTVAEGEGGVLVAANPKMSRKGSFNRLVVTGSNATSGPVTAEALDTDPASPTYFWGNYGQVTRQQSSDLITTQVQAQRVADAGLRAQLGRQTNLNLSMVPNPALEEGDKVLVRRVALGIDEGHVIEDLTIGLGIGDVMSATTLASVTG